MAQTNSDMVVVKNEDNVSRPFRSSFAFTSGVYYYEVIRRTDGEMRFGWATREAKLSWKEIGDDKYSIGLELRKEFYIIYHNDYMNRNKIKYRIQNVSQLNSLIGCLIDTSNRQFHFYINGKQVKSLDNLHFSTWPYYATVSLGEGQECQLNFGQVPFKFPPKDIRFSNFNEASGKIEKNQMTETFQHRSIKSNFNYFWFAHPVIGGHIDLFYFDPEQVECDELVRQLENIVPQKTTRLIHSVKCGRLVQSVIEVLGRRLTWNPNDIVGKWVMKKIVEIENKGFEQAKLLKLLYPYLQLSSTTTNSSKRYNICLILIMLNFKCDFIDNLLIFTYIEILFDQIFKTFLNPRIFIMDPWTMIYALNYFEQRFYLLSNIQEITNHPSLMTTLNWCSELFGHVSSVTLLYEPSCDLVRLQAGMWVKWFRDLVIQSGEQHFPSQSTLNPQDKTNHIKLSCDCLSARNDYESCQSVRSVCSVSSDIFYYEAVLLTNGEMKIGWATKQTELDWNGIGHDKYSIGFDGSDRHKIYHQKENFYSLNPNFTSKRRWSVGDVVGCLIDCDIKIFKFYLNEKLVKCKEKLKNEYGREYFINFSTKPYHAAVSLYRHQQCYLNLGQCPFRYPPSVSFRTFNLFSPIPPPTPLYSPRLSECYSLVQVLEKDRIELMFVDNRQMESDQLVGKFKENIENILNSENVQINLKDKVYRLRLLQSLILGSGPKLLDSCLSIHASWNDNFITQSTSDNPAFPDLVAQLLYPYFTLHLTNDTVNIHQNVCIVLSSLMTAMEDFPLRFNLYQQFLIYFTQIVTNYNLVEDEWLLIFTLICLEKIEMTDSNKKSIKANSKFCKILEAQSYSSYHTQIDQYKISKFVLHQSEFFTSWFLDHVLNSIQQSDDSNSKATLNPLDRSPHLKLSPSRLIARSDHQWQSVRSICSANKVIYYEVTLHTSGTMRIGWTNKRCHLSGDPIGSDDSSVGFDGHNQCVWHENRRIKLLKAKEPVPRWKAGDIIGCLIDVEGKSFSFYLNRQLVYIHSIGFFSKLHQYYAAVSLHTYQQCQFNFGPTVLPPPRTDFHTFNSILDIRGSVTNLARTIGHSINNSIVLVKSSFKADSVKMQQNSDYKEQDKNN